MTGLKLEKVFTSEDLIPFAILFTVFGFLFWALAKDPNLQHRDKTTSGWREIKIETISGEVITMSCPVRATPPAGAHSVDCYIKLKDDKS
jgi:hypothetical protein